MNAKKINQVLEEVLKKAKPSESDLSDINNYLKDFLNQLGKKVKASKIKAEIFIGGSYAKRTMINKKVYDVDIFLRFDDKEKNISNQTEDLLSTFKKTKVHGSRDYFFIEVNHKILFEVIPVLKIKRPEYAKNITDLSYFHVSYMKKKLKPEKIFDEIVLAKTFCYANNCYGAESYIKGFSGYGLELLILYYGSFLKFVKEMAKSNENEKILIDIEKHFKNKQEIMMNLNSSKLQSPIVFVDPTYKQRNVLAALSEDTFRKFKKSCNEFLKNPKNEFFEQRKTDLEEIKKNAEKKRQEFVLIEVKTDKQEGDIAGSKLLKFYNYLNSVVSLYFEIKNKGFNYNNKKSARYFFIAKPKKEILFKGPKINDEKNLSNFKRKHKSTFIKLGRVYAKEKTNFDLNYFIKNWKKKNRKQMKEMSIVDIYMV